MRTLYLLTMTLLCTSVPAAPVPKELKKQQVSIVGSWKLESAMVHGVATEIYANDTDWTIDQKHGLIRSGDQKVRKVPTNHSQLRIDTATNANADLMTFSSDDIPVYRMLRRAGSDPGSVNSRRLPQSRFRRL